jgi:hypothetical protein
MLKLVSCLICLPVHLFSQAWLSPKGEGSASVLFQYGIERLHAFADGRTKDRGHTFLTGVLVDVDFSVTDKLAVRVAAPYISGKYIGINGHTLVRGRPETAVLSDNGSFHGSLQDFRFDVRYSLSRRALKVVPFFQTTTPSHDYPTLAHAAGGGRCSQTQLRRTSTRLFPHAPAFSSGRIGLDK